MSLFVFLREVPKVMSEARHDFSNPRKLERASWKIARGVRLHNA
jgi:hypothetical protein